MSKYLRFSDVIFKSQPLLLGALADLGYDQVEVGDKLSLYGYREDRRAETAEIVVRREHVSSASNDLGFVRTDQGYVPIVSEYDQSTLHGGKFLVKLRTAYSERVVDEVKKRLHGTAHRTVEGSVVKIRVRY